MPSAECPGGDNPLTLLGFQRNRKNPLDKCNTLSYIGFVWRVL